MRALVACSFALLCLFSAASSEGGDNGSIEDEITYAFYSRSYFDGIFTHIYEDPDFVNIRRVFNPKKPTVVLIHGYQDGYGADSNTYVRKAILEKTDANIIKIDWSTLAGGSYFVARDSVPYVGLFAAQFLQRVAKKFHYSISNVTLVGFSLGAHIAGNLGRTLGGKVGVIVALDPAGPFIEGDLSVTKSDGKYVQSIHTNGGMLGMTAAVGHADFYPNGGSRQPGCGLDLVGGCAHNRAWEFFAESVNDNRFVSQECSTWDEYNKNACNGTFKLMGGLSNIDKTARGIYYLATNNQSPYGRG
ncbi:pancreatic lipase-related protein 2-like [Sitophilus oryzae]|uniref:Pancreatic lipase-related protein 2-like n=1 Tax=Sitophilus oryzae TaxID=7048 RepID=A0A6J2XBW2_SITOR|nr:pancreatic lipase-related protein 2-like [Sitophilus oryzae]